MASILLEGMDICKLSI